jgi:hypothetical protein
MLSKQSKLRGVTEGGPPPFVPFRHTIQDAKVVNQKGIISDVWEIKFYAPNNIKTIKMSRYSIY